ncbi:MAG: hypothetical protein A3E84_04645 [Gammaproteobacteria bacterium RIFCSPHIGHO2_12_FULL_42_13]|nr:MAG: hypothetical protein A3E84_04645 [Gammaproteobacteria bacterium RIFCSPHIGHO2_12_FULL_42_13]
MEHITVTPLHLVGQDDRGTTHDYSVRENSDYILIMRKQGSISGNTYHKGKNKATNPKTFVLISGEVKLTFRHIDEKQYYTMCISEPSIIAVKPFVTHAMEAITNMIVLECNSIADIQDDRYRESVIQEKVGITE